MDHQLSIRFFNGPPKGDDLRAGEAGVNATLFDQLIQNKPSKNPHWLRLLFHIFMAPQRDGLVPSNSDLAEVIGVHHTTIHRQKKNLESLGLIYRVNFIGGFGYHPNMLVVKTEEGRIVRYPRYVREHVTADSLGTDLSV